MCLPVTGCCHGYQMISRQPRMHSRNRAYRAYWRSWVAALTGPRRPSIALPRDAAEGRFWGANAGAWAAEI